MATDRAKAAGWRSHPNLQRSQASHETQFSPKATAGPSMTSTATSLLLKQLKWTISHERRRQGAGKGTFVALTGQLGPQWRWRKWQRGQPVARQLQPAKSNVSRGHDETERNRAKHGEGREPVRDGTRTATRRAAKSERRQPMSSHRCMRCAVLAAPRQRTASLERLLRDSSRSPRLQAHHNRSR